MKSRVATRLIPWFVLLAGLVWIIISKAPAGSTTAGSIPAPRPGFLAPDFTLQTTSGELITLSELRGRPVIINLWASWCPPCRAEMPALQSVYTDLSRQGLVVLAVNATNQDNLSDATAFVDELGLTFPILLDMDGKVSALYQLQSLPTTFFVGKGGTIEEVVVGGPMAEALLRIRVEQLLEDKTP